MINDFNKIRLGSIIGWSNRWIGVVIKFTNDEEFPIIVARKWRHAGPTLNMFIGDIENSDCKLICE